MLSGTSTRQVEADDIIEFTNSASEGEDDQSFKFQNMVTSKHGEDATQVSSPSRLREVPSV